MYDTVLIIWLVIFLIFLIVNISQQSTIFGAIAGIWLMTLALFIIATGVQTESGVEITDVGDSTVYEYQFSDVTLPYSTYSYIWGIILILVAVYILYANLLK
jgi:beta-lactamase superfamily II metal-dependent hydrolase